MNRIFTYVSAIIIAWAFASPTMANNAVFSVNDKFSDQEIEYQISQLSSNIDLVYNKEIKNIINTYISAGRPNTEAILSRSQYYFPLMEKIIEQKQLPEELKYLSVIESGLRPKVKSRVGAVGLWQFMSSTAKYYDLRIHSSVDERKDVRKSTEAALLYLNDLYKRFGDWTLALAAYNCGPGNVNKAIRKSGGKKDYWKIRRFLPKETRRYIPKMIATMYVMNHFEDYGLNDETVKYSEHNAFGLAAIYDKTSFDHISEYSGLTVKELRKYNPSYAKNYIPASSKGNYLIMPEAYLLTFLQNKGLMSHLKDVFYMKSSIVTSPVFASSSLETKRDAFAIESIQVMGTDLLEMPELTWKVDVSITEILSDKLVATHRLRKRQTLTSFLEENEIDPTIYRVELSDEGVIRLFHN